MTTLPTIGVGLRGYGLAGAVLHALVIEALPDHRIGQGSVPVDPAEARDVVALIAAAHAGAAMPRARRCLSSVAGDA